VNESARETTRREEEEAGVPLVDTVTLDQGQANPSDDDGVVVRNDVSTDLRGSLHHVDAEIYE